MKKKATLAALALGWCLAAHGAAAQETDGDAIVRDLISEDPGRVSRALESLMVFIPREGFKFRDVYEITTELVEALVAALEHEHMLGNPNGELNLALLDAVVATEHPLTVGILTRAQWSSDALEVLLSFGPSVLPGVVELAMSPEATPQEAWGRSTC